MHFGSVWRVETLCIDCGVCDLFGRDVGDCHWEWYIDKCELEMDSASGYALASIWRRHASCSTHDVYYTPTRGNRCAEGIAIAVFLVER